MRTQTCLLQHQVLVLQGMEVSYSLLVRMCSFGLHLNAKQAARHATVRTRTAASKAQTMIMQRMHYPRLFVPGHQDRWRLPVPRLLHDPMPPPSAIALPGFAVMQPAAPMSCI